MAVQRKSNIEGPITGLPEAGPGDDAEVAEALRKASSAFFDALKKSGLKPVTEAGGFDRGGCGHDRSK
jgi:uncharacterized protein DUF6817